MNKDIVDSALVCFQNALLRTPAAYIVVELRHVIYIVLKSIQDDVQQLQIILPMDGNEEVALSGLPHALDKLIIRLNISKQPSSEDNPEEVLNSYRQLWNQPDLEASMILNILIDSIRSITGSLYARIDLLKISIIQEPSSSYSSLVYNVGVLKSIRDIVLQYLNKSSSNL